MPCAAKPCLPAHLLLAMYVLVQVSLGEGSWCFPYMATLPAEFPTLELLYLDQFGFMATMPSLAREKTFSQQRKIKAEFEEVKGFVQLLEKLGCSPASRFTADSFRLGDLHVGMERFLWAWLVVNTRSIYLHDPKEPASAAGLAPIALAPYLDLLNHNPQTKVSDVYDSKSGTFTFLSGQTYQPGEQVFITYGAHDNITLMIEYGFVIPHNLYDHVCIDDHVWGHLVFGHDSVENLDDVLAEKLSPLPIMEVLQQTGLLRNFAIQSDGEPDFRLMNFLRLWHLPCYNADFKPAQSMQHLPLKRQGTAKPEATAAYWLDLWHSVWSGTSEAFPEKHTAIEAAVYCTLLKILISASESATLKLRQVCDSVSRESSLGERDLLAQIKTILMKEIELLNKAQIWVKENAPAVSY